MMKYELLYEKCDGKIPFISPTSWRIPYKFSPFPKSLSKYVLDNYQCYMDIERIFKYLKEHPNKPMVRGASPTIFMGAQHTAHVDGADIFDTGAGYTDSGTPSDTILAGAMNAGIVGQFYDRLACQMGASGGNGNIRLGVYEETSSKPDVLEGETGSFAHVVDSYTWQSITEYDLTNTANWCAMNASSSLDQISVDLTGETNSRWYKTHTFGAFLDPFGAGGTNDDAQHECKMGHS